jgi:electron transport complex protein RnfC
MKILGAGRGIVGIEANKVDAFEKMRDALWAENSVAVYLLEVKYPQGAEKQLIDALAGREIPAGKLPLDVGIVVQNVATANAVFEAVTKNIPLIERPVTITGDGIGKPANLMVPIGTPISVLLKRQEVSAKTRKLIMGGPMMGLAVPDAEFPILKGTSGVLALINTPNYMPGPCIRCGKCIEVCPLRGVAAEMGAAIEAGLVEKYEQLHVLDCVECGTCTFACPAHRSIVHHVKKAKAEYEAYRAAKEKKEKEES